MAEFVDHLFALFDMVLPARPMPEPYKMNEYTIVLLIELSASFMIYLVLSSLTAIKEPLDYKLDMTTEEYCKTVAEIDNQLRVRRGSGGEFYLSKSASHNDQQAVDCATMLNGCASVSGESEAASAAEAAMAQEHCIVGAQHNASERLQDEQSNGCVDHVYPNGWIPVIESEKVAPGTIKKAIVFGRDLIITRSADGRQVNVLDAYCPHMGVHIGIAGKVQQVDNESCVECPFHGWTYRARDGQCVKIPYSKYIPKQAKLGAWPTVEVDNFIYVWYHADNQPPSWHLEPTQELFRDDWQLAGRSSHKTYLEIRDMLQNGADMNHFEAIHNDLFLFGSKLSDIAPIKYLQKYVRHCWDPSWQPVYDEHGRPTHIAEMRLQSWITVFGIRTFDITILATQIGPAKVNLYYKSRSYGEGVMIMNSIPIGGRLTKYIQHIYTKNTLFHCFMAKWTLYGEILMLERDFAIWNHKKNIKNPLFVPEDKVLKRFRQWYSNFYRRRRSIKIQ